MLKTSAAVLSTCCLLAGMGTLLSRAAAPAAPAAQGAADARQEFIRSLAMRADRIIADSTLPTYLWISQTSPVSYRPAGPTTVKLSLAPPAANAAPIKDLGTFTLLPRDLMQKPFALAAEPDIGGAVADGNYRLVATVMEGATVLATLEQPIWLVKGIDARRGAIVERLAKINGHENTKASVMYPFDVARVVNSGRRRYNDQDLGIDQAGQPNYLNFANEMNHSEELLAALEAGKDPLWQAKGDTKQHYYFAEADEIMPYHVWVPPAWDGKTPLPMVFILHGNTRNQDFYFERDGQVIPKTAEKYGFMLVGVFGYHPNGGYNLSSMSGRGGGAGPVAFGPAVAGAGAGAGRGGRGGAAFLNGMPQSRIGQLSEADAMNVFDLVKKEYPIDPKRTFLFGYSAGGNGGFYIGGKYADNWAAIAIGGAGSNIGAAYPYYDKLNGLHTPFFIYYGEKDTVGNGSMNNVQSLKQHGISADLKSYPGADHDGTPSVAVADAFEFFSKHPRP